MNPEFKGKRPAFRFLFTLIFILDFSIWMNSQEKSVQIKLASSLEIGRTDLLFSSIGSVCEDDQLNFYVLDRMEHKVFKFSPQGRLLLAFGQKGQGPGDFQSPDQIVFTSQGELAVKNQITAVRISADYVFVFRFAPDITDKNSLSSVDVFTRKGEFLGAAQLKEVPLFISKRAMYFSRISSYARPKSLS